MSEETPGNEVSREERRAEDREARRERLAERREARRERTHYRSLFWPLVLIGAGALWFLSNLEIISGENLSVLLRLWPLIFIVIGLDLLFGRRSPFVGGLIGLLTVALVVVLVMVGPSLGLASETTDFFGVPVIVGGDVEVKHDTFSEPLDGAESADVSLDLAVEKTIVGALPESSDDLMTADLDYVGDIRFETSGERSRRVVLDETGIPANLGTLNRADEMVWDIGLSPSVPMELAVDMGAGSASLDLRGLQLSSFDLEGGAGSLELWLPATGETYDSAIDVGFGSVDLDVDEDAATRLEMSGGAGSVNVAVGDGADLTLDLEMGGGSLSLSLGDDVNADVQLGGGAGSMSIDVPEDAALRVEVREGGPSSVSVPDRLERVEGRADGDTGVWQSDDYERAERRITIVVTEMGAGSFSVG